MFNPEPTDLFVSTLCLYLAARMLVRRSYGWKPALGLGIALGAGEMVRQFSLWTLAVVVLAFLAALLVAAGGAARARARRSPSSLAAVVVDRCAVVRLSRGELRQRGLRPAALVEAALGAPAREVLRRSGARHDSSRRPYRPNFVNLALPETYADMWGDWYGVFAWSNARRRRSRRRRGTAGSSCRT